MIRLNLSGVWVDLVNPEFEMKWKHPIQNSLKGESSTYSTDLTVPLTKNNKIAFDYKIFGTSTKTNIYLYGTLFVNGMAMRVRCYVREFSSKGITFFLEQFIAGGTSDFLKDTTTIDKLFLSEIQAQTKRDVLIDVATGAMTSSVYGSGDQLPLIFDAISANGRPNVYTDFQLLEILADFYGITLNNAPENYLVFANQWKLKTGIYCRGLFSNLSSGAGLTVMSLISGDDPLFNIYINDLTGRIISAAPFKVNFKISLIEYYGDSGDAGSDMKAIFQLKNVSTLEVINIGEFDYSIGENVVDGSFQSQTIPAGTYILQVSHAYGIHIVGYASQPTIEPFIDYTDLELATPNYSGYADFGALGYYTCWQNLPKVTAKDLIETIALCAAKIVQYTDTSINFIDFADVFGWENAIDVSDKLISWKSKSFTFLQSNNATVTYADGTIIATVKVNDPTLPNTINNVATVNAIRIQDDDGVERITDKVVLSETTTGHFDIIEKLSDIYAPLTEPKLFEAEFKYFAESKQPLLIRQLGGIFLALESIATTKKVITLKLIKIH